MSGRAIVRRIGTDLPDVVRWGAAVGLLVCVAAGIGVLTVQSAVMALLAGIAVLAVGMATVNLSLVAMLTFPATLVMIRVGGALSVSDVILAAATVPCLLLMRFKEAADLKPLLWLGLTYQAMLLPTLALNPYGANFVEWVHEAFLVGGSLIVGWVAGRYGHARKTINIYTALCCVLAVATIIMAIIWFGEYGKFLPVSLPNFHKNFIGNTLAYTFLIAFVRPKWLGWSQRVCVALMALSAVGIAASQARQSVISVLVAVVILSFRGRQAGLGKARVLLIMLLPALWVVVRTVQDQLALHDNFNSTSQRLIWFAQSIEIWKTSPLFGVGLRWWYTGDYPMFQPPNGILEMLSSAGIVGVLAFLILFGGATWVIFKLDPRYGNIALAIVVARFTQGELDLYWVAGQASFLWLITGLAYGLQASERYHLSIQPEDPLPAEQRPTQMARQVVHGPRWRLPADR
ncbi:MAG: O-antigen ligase family protein [Propionibacteriaceae bacterium]